ncbi:MAG: DUF4129 domain-containing protein [Thaumarchaeota archaeon]|nr:DUF4129 domain-containing protein [Nitrososphaerota archaeon]
MNKLVLLLMIALISSSIIVPNLPRHLDPQQVEPELPSKLGLLTLYGSVIDSVVVGDFIGASEAMEDLLKIYVPENLRYIYDRFNELLDRELQKLNETNVQLNECESELSEGLLEDAEERLEKAGRALAEAEIIQQELEDSSREVARTFGIPFSQLSERVGKLEELIKSYRERLSLLSAELGRLREAKISDTRLMIWANCSEVLIGSGIRIEGFLLDEYGNPLEGRAISIYAERKKVKELLTRDDGGFEAVVAAPQVYKPEVELFAEYVPSGADVGRFRASRSNVIVLKLTYEIPEIEASINATNLLPLEAFEIFGQVKTLSGQLPDKIYLSAFGNTISTEISEDGIFKLALRVPSSASTGAHELILYTRPSGILAPAREVLELKVYRLPVRLEVEAPKIALSGTSITLRVRVLAEGNPSGEVMLRSFGSSSSIPARSGVLLLNLTAPLTAFSGIELVKLTFNPKSPIYESSSAQVEILILNPLTALVPIAAALYLMRIGFRGLSSMRRIALEKGEVEAIEKIRERAVRRAPEGISRIYLEAVRLVEELIGVRRRSSETIREFLERVSERLGEGALAFEELSYMAEAAIYGEVEPDLDLARHLLEAIRGLRHEI